VLAGLLLEVAVAVVTGQALHQQFQAAPVEAATVVIAEKLHQVQVQILRAQVAVALVMLVIQMLELVGQALF
jgi:hypothetical protein